MSSRKIPPPLPPRPRNTLNSSFEKRIKLFKASRSRSKNSRKSRSVSISRGRTNTIEKDMNMCMNTLHACEKAYKDLEKDMVLCEKTVDSCERACEILEKKNEKLTKELKSCDKEKEHYWKLYNNLKDNYKKMEDKLKFFSELGKKKRNTTVKGQVIHVLQGHVVKNNNKTHKNN
jgi:chromosome segregation ATPase